MVRSSTQWFIYSLLYRKFQGFRSCSALYQDDKTIIVILTNAYDSPVTGWLMATKSILDAFANSWDEFILKDVEEKPDFSELIGFYKSGGGAVYLSQIGDRLVSILPDNLNPLSTAILFDHEEEMTFTSPKEMVFA